MWYKKIHTLVCWPILKFKIDLNDDVTWSRFYYMFRCTFETYTSMHKFKIGQEIDWLWIAKETILLSVCVNNKLNENNIHMGMRCFLPLTLNEMVFSFSQIENKSPKMRKNSKEPQQVLGEKYQNFNEIVKCKMRKQMGQCVK